jgi:hypothetical protein
VTADVTLPPWFEHGAPRLVCRLHDDGGFTVDPRTGTTPTSGFAVNTGTGALVVPGPAFFVPDGAGVLADFVRRHPDLLDPRSAVLLGGWYHRGSDRVVLSRVDHVVDRTEAVARGAARRQTDVYDLGDGRTVPTGFVRRG